MSVDKLQNQIRKLKNPTAVQFVLDRMQIPPSYLEKEASIPVAYGSYARDIMAALKGLVPAVRFSFGAFSLWGSEGLDQLSRLMDFAAEQGYYVLLDAPEMLSAREAVLAAETFLKNESQWKCDGLLFPCYIGSDSMKPFADSLKENEKDLFLVLRTANRSAPELQELLTGTRLVYTAAADMAKRMGEGHIGRCGYSRIGGLGPATSADSLRALRSKYPALFLIVDGSDYSGANAKNCSYAFDKLGHGALVCAGASITGAWQDEHTAVVDAVAVAVQAAERIKKNLTRYVTIL